MISFILRYKKLIIVFLVFYQIFYVSAESSIDVSQRREPPTFWETFLASPFALDLEWPCHLCKDANDLSRSNENLHKVCKSLGTVFDWVENNALTLLCILVVTLVSIVTICCRKVTGKENDQASNGKHPPGLSIIKGSHKTEKRVDSLKLEVASGEQKLTNNEFYEELMEYLGEPQANSSFCESEGDRVQGVGLASLVCEENDRIANGVIHRSNMNLGKNIGEMTHPDVAKEDDESLSEVSTIYRSNTDNSGNSSLDVSLLNKSLVFFSSEAQSPEEFVALCLVQTMVKNVSETLWRTYSDKDKDESIESIDVSDVSS